MSNQKKSKDRLEWNALKYFNYYYLRNSKKSVENKEIDVTFGRVSENFWILCGISVALCSCVRSTGFWVSSPGFNLSVCTYELWTFVDRAEAPCTSYPYLKHCIRFCTSWHSICKDQILNNFMNQKCILLSFIL